MQRHVDGWVRRARRLAALVLCASLVVSGCGGDSDGGSGSPDAVAGDTGDDTRPFDVTMPDTHTPPEDTQLHDTKADTGPPPDLLASDIAPGAFGAPCISNEECDSGWCIESVLGPRCTQTCLSSDGCPEGWLCRDVGQTAPDPVFVCVPPLAEICAPCLSETQCGKGACIAMEPDARYCTSPCEGPADCPEVGFACRTVAGREDEGSFCMPDSGTCSCMEANRDELRPCFLTNEIGTCYGFETCDPSQGWMGCDAPPAELEECNGLDDDCDGVPDDDIPLSQSCEQEAPGIGSCPGLAVCQGLAGWVCDAPIPTVERCDYRDNDCNGETDEDFQDASGRYVSEFHCGVCNNACEGSLPNAASEYCDATQEPPQCVVGECDPGFFPVSPFACAPRSNVVCRPCATDDSCEDGVCKPIGGANFCTRPCLRDDDCEAPYTCETLPNPAGGILGSFCALENHTCDCPEEADGTRRVCMHENEVGTCYGFEMCDAVDGWVGCDARVPAAEDCNGVDDDCNGVPDDGLPEERTCQRSNPDGVCYGTDVCLGVLGWRCEALEPTEELCDYIDNDCDSQTDETWKVNGRLVNFNHCGACNASCSGSVPNGTSKCAVVEGAPMCVVDECSQGYVQLGNFLCVEPRDTFCNPCAIDEHCVGLSCVQFEGGPVCLGACETQEDCGQNQDCVSVGLQGSFCTPTSGTCTCTAVQDGAQRPCQRENEQGTCAGYEVCDPAVGWTGCTAPVPAEEDCNGFDDNCNGLFDEDLPTDRTCDNQNVWGTCTAPEVCGGTLGWLCTAPEPSQELCDHLDNDCDDEIDEIFKVDGQYAQLLHCGDCNQSCRNYFPNATARCDATTTPPRCVIDECAPGFIKVNDFLCVPEQSNICEPCTNDLDCLRIGAVCLPMADGAHCVEPCETVADCPSGYVCQVYAGGGPDDKQCIPQSGSCECLPEHISNIRACEETWEEPGVGSYTCTGQQTCYASGWTQCDVPDEACDGYDNDCDGEIDEGFRVDGRYVTREHCGACDNSCAYLDGPEAEGVCDDSDPSSPPSCDMVCTPGWVDVNDVVADGCECLIQPGIPDNPDLSQNDTNCDGVDGDIARAVFVAKYGQAGAPGTITAPLLSIQAGIDLAEADPDRDHVYVASGVYEERIVLANGVHVYGGYRTDYRERDPSRHAVVILGPAPSGSLPAAVNAFDIFSTGGGGATLDGFVIYGYDNPLPGRSSMAVYLRNCGSEVRLASNRIIGGNAGHGLSGNWGVSGDAGGSGGSGLPAATVGTAGCTQNALVNPGGTAGALTCGGVPRDGGRGGGAFCPDHDRPPEFLATEKSGAAGQGGTPAAAGGPGGFDRYRDNSDGTSCDVAREPLANRVDYGADGVDGAPGVDGLAGNGCSDPLGTVSAAGTWSTSSGSFGNGGGAGNGGGGGGGGGGIDVLTAVCDTTYDEAVGGSGGGGGAGGCGGAGGAGGSSGGASFAVLLHFTVSPATIGLPTLVTNTIYRGEGGNGGGGGVGGMGGSGGLGGTGGAGGAAGTGWERAGPGGSGGSGGAGGSGGGGGGGCGGPAVAIAAYTVAHTSLDGYSNFNFFPGGGEGGDGGTGGFSPGHTGVDGASGPTETFQVVILGAR